MITKAVRLYGKNDLRLEIFELPALAPDEILAKVICDSICMSSYKAATTAQTHKRIPKDVGENPVIIGHEFAGEIIEVGSKWKGDFSTGDKFSIQPALNYEGGPVGILSAPGYSYRYIGGDATYIIIPDEVMRQGCLLKYNGKGFYQAALAEPMSCVIGALHANYHTSPGSYDHRMDIVEGGSMAIFAGVGPMGLAMIDYILHRDKKPSLLVVTDIDKTRLERAARLFPSELAAAKGIRLIYINTGSCDDPAGKLRSINGGRGYDDVFVMAPVASVIEQADAVLGFDGCLNFFAGPADSAFSAKLNFYNVHYSATHVAGTSGGNTEDMKEALQLMARGLDPAGLVTHIGGLDSVVETTLDLPSIPGGKKLIYTHLQMPLVAIGDFGKLGEENPAFTRLDEICSAHNGLWNTRAEKYLLDNPEAFRLRQ
ncbi:MAG: zinc-binding dehydrogenase [Rikenellaceae bacterium]|nr:zinc-binding dehydrogenase [Rikenellaceae bacterium]